MSKIFKKIFINLLSFVLCFTFIISSMPIYASEVFDSSVDVTEILKNASQFQTEDGRTYKMVILPEKEADIFLDDYLNSKQRNILPNLVMFSYTRFNNRITMKVKNIAVDSLDAVYGYINLYDNQTGLCGSGSFSFHNIPAFGSDYATIYSMTGTWNGGMMFAEAMDGSVMGNGVFYFSR